MKKLCWKCLKSGLLLFVIISSATAILIDYKGSGFDPIAEIQKLRIGGIILGVMPTEIPYSYEKVQLKENDVLVMFTDGVSEAMNKDGKEYGDERFEEIVINLKDKSANDILDGIKSYVQKFAEGSPQSDDITMIIMKVKYLGI